MLKASACLQAFLGLSCACSPISCFASFPWLIRIHPAGFIIEAAFSRKVSCTPGTVISPGPMNFSPQSTQHNASTVPALLDGKLRGPEVACVVLPDPMPGRL